LVNTFLTQEQELSTWRKQVAVSLDEEAFSKSLDVAQEMSIPSDLEIKFDSFKQRLPTLVDYWNSVVAAVERLSKRREGCAIDWNKINSGVQGILQQTRDNWKLDSTEKVEDGLETFAQASLKESEVMSQKSKALNHLVLENLKRNRELFSDFQALCRRHEVLAKVRTLVDDSKAFLKI
jgi:hypothetical protein